MGFISFLLSWKYYPISLEISIPLEFGILTIFTLFFSFAGIKSNLQNQFREKMIDFIEENKNFSRNKIDILLSIIDKRQKDILSLLGDMGKTFRLCIYFGIAIIPLLFLNDYFKSISFEMFIGILVLSQLWGLFINVHRFKEFYELDLEEEIEEQKLRFEKVNIAAHEGNYEILQQILKKKKGLWGNLKSNLLSLFKFKF